MEILTQTNRNALKQSVSASHAVGEQSIHTAARGALVAGGVGPCLCVLMDLEEFCNGSVLACCTQEIGTANRLVGG